MESEPLEAWKKSRGTKNLIKKDLIKKGLINKSLINFIIFFERI